MIYITPQTDTLIKYLLICFDILLYRIILQMLLSIPDKDCKKTESFIMSRKLVSILIAYNRKTFRTKKIGWEEAGRVLNPNMAKM